MHNWHLAQFDQQAQEDVWSDDPTVRVSSSRRRWARAWWSTAAYLVNGTWLWSSGCDRHLDLRRGPVIRTAARSFGSFLMPLGDYQIRDDWNVVGLKATGSNTLIVRTSSCPGTGSCPTAR